MQASLCVVNPVSEHTHGVLLRTGIYIIGLSFQHPDLDPQMPQTVVCQLFYPRPV